MSGCQLDVSSDDCKYTFIPKEQECKDKISLDAIIKHFFPKVNLEKVSGSLLDPGIIQIERFELDKCEGDVTFECSAKESFDIIKDKVKVKKAKVKVALNYKKDITFENFGIDLNGEVMLGGHSVPLTLSKKKESAEFKFSIKTDKVKASDFTGMFSKKKLDEEKETPQNEGMFTNAELIEPTIYGRRGKDESFEFVAKGQVSGIQGFGTFNIIVLVQKNADDATATAVIADIKKIEPAQLLYNYIGHLNLLYSLSKQISKSNYF